jgi:hypothetical protein
MGWLVADAPAPAEPSGLDGAAEDGAAEDGAAEDGAENGEAVALGDAAVDELGDVARLDGATCAADVEWHAVATSASTPTAPRRARDVVERTTIRHSLRLSIICSAP